MISIRSRTGMVVLAGVVALSSPCAAEKAGSPAKGKAPKLRGRCPPIAFVKRHHFKRPFGIGTIIGWDIHTPGCGIYTCDPRHPDGGEREIFRRDDGTIFDMSASFDAKKLLFSFRSVKGKQRSRRSGLLSASHVYSADTLDMVLSPSAPTGSGQKPNHSFWPHKETREWMEIKLPGSRRLSSVSVYWFDDQPRGGCAVPESWRLEYDKGGKWLAVKDAAGYGVKKDTWNTVRFTEVETSRLRVVLKCRAGFSAGIQRWRIGSKAEHAALVSGPAGEKQQANERSFHIYEINVDGTGLRQITTGRFHDIHPLYLPDGKIAFVTTRVKAFTLCQPGAACALYVMDPDGTNMRRIHFGTLSDNSPFLMDDGSILWTRWEYQDKSLTYPQGLWTVNPDGTRLQMFFGNTIYEPAVTWQAKPIPGSSNVVCTLSPHHGNPIGAVGIIDRTKGMENPKAIRNITPEIPYRPELNRPGPGDRQHPWSYRDPYPIAKDLFLVAYGGPAKGGPHRFRLFVLDDKGRKELIHEDKRISCFNPVPLVPRKPPTLKPALPPSSKKYGTFVVTDVYQGMTGVERGRVKEIRVMKVLPKPCNMRGRRAYDMDPLCSRGTYYVKCLCGTAPVDQDGTACFKAPAGAEIYFQALDADGKELQRMGTVTQIMPGEKQGCIGCHEPDFTAPPNGGDFVKLLRKKPADLTPPPWGADPMDFVRHVQPAFDKYCVKCHSGHNPKKGMDLSGDKTRFFNMAYDNLLNRRLVDYTWLHGASAKNWRPLTTGSRVSKLVTMIEKKHSKVDMDDQNRRRIYAWIDANVPYYGTYEHTRPGRPGCRDACLGEPWFGDFEKIYRAKCAACHGGFYRGSSGTHHTWINLTHPEWSRVLTATLSKDAGGLQLCKPKNRRQPALFKNKSDPTYQAMLKAIEAGRKALYANPRVDMPGAKPKPYPQDFGKLYSGFSGP